MPCKNKSKSSHNIRDHISQKQFSGKSARLYASSKFLDRNDYEASRQILAVNQKLSKIYQVFSNNHLDE